MYFNNRFKLGDTVRINNTNYKYYGVVGRVYQIAHVITDSPTLSEPEYIEYMVENEENVYCGLRQTDLSFSEAPKHTLIQELKEQLLKANQKIEELDNLYRLRTNAHCDTIDQLAAKDKSALSNFTNEITKSK